MRHIADDCLSALVHRDVLDPDGLIASAPVSFERLYLRRERPGELVESAFRAVLLRGVFHIGEPTRESERAEVTVEQVVRELKLLGFSDIRKVVSWRNELVTRTEKGEDGEPVMVLMPRVTIVDPIAVLQIHSCGPEIASDAPCQQNPFLQTE